VTTAPVPVGVGLIGCGMIGQIHADGLAKLAADGEIRAVAAADPSAEARAAASRNVAGPDGPGFEQLHADGRAVIADPRVEAVMVTTPTAAHRDLVLAVVESGKPLFCEKPLAPTFAAVRELCDAVARSGVVAQVGFHSRFHPIWARFADIVRSGELGRPMGYTLRDDQYWPTGDVVPGHSSWRSERAQAGGGALLEHSIHSADLLSWLFGPARNVYARTRNVFGYDVEDTAALTIEHEGGVVGNLVTVFNGVRGREERRFEAFFERGAVEITTDFVVGAPEDSFLIQRPDEAPERVDLDALRENHFASLGITRRDFLFYTYPADRAWVHAVRAGTPAAPGFADALAAHALVEAAYRSAVAGAPVDLAGDLAPGVPA
jgi:predicted dehydrogenase